MQIKIVQWNIFYKEKLSNILSELKKINPDVVCLQEVRVNSSFNPKVNGAAYLAKGLKFYYHFGESHFFDKKEIQGNLILSRFPIVRKYSKYIQKFNPQKTNRSEDEGRLYMEVSLKVDNRELRVGTSHLSFKAGHVLSAQRQKEMNNFLKELSKQKEGYIFGGDLNAVPTSAFVKGILKTFKNVGPRLTGPSADKKKYTESKKLGNHSVRIDYIFSTEEIKVKKAEILKTKFSDHFPIVAVIDF